MSVNALPGTTRFQKCPEFHFIKGNECCLFTHVLNSAINKKLQRHKLIRSRRARARPFALNTLVIKKTLSAMHYTLG